MDVRAAQVAELADTWLRTRDVTDYPGALNGLQLDHAGPVRRLGAAVDISRRVIEAAVAGDINLLLVHHGLFWNGAERLVGPAYERLRLLFRHDIAVYASHLPLDAHESLGNNVLLARALGVVPSRPFAEFKGTAIGVAGDADLPTVELLQRVERFATRHQSGVRTSAVPEHRLTRRWAICSGAGASTETLTEAAMAGVDTLIVGEGPHHTAVMAPELDVTVIYAGHYATETLGVSALAAALGNAFQLDWQFIDAPTGL